MSGGGDRGEDRAPGGGTAPRDPAASMSLLTSLLNNPLDAGYVAHGPRESGAARTVMGRALVGAAALALGFASAITVRSLRSVHTDAVKDQLRGQVAAQQSAVADLQGQIQSLSSSVASYAGQSGAAGDEPALTLENSAQPVSGDGLVVTLADRAGRTGRGSGLVRDQDIAMVVNALWAAGAEAVSVNGQRVGPGTFIRTAGPTILVNITPVASPYSVAAIGDANAMSVALVRGATGDYLSSAQSVNGITVHTETASGLAMPALEQLPRKYARPNDQGGAQ